MSPDPKNCRIVLVAFGTSADASAIYSGLLQRFEERFEQTIPMGFTSRVGKPALRTVLADLSPDKRTDLVIVPLVMIPGRVFLDDIQKVVMEYGRSFKSVALAQPLLPDGRLFDILKKELQPEWTGPTPEETGLLFVGHGTPDRDAAQIYIDCARKLASCFPPSVTVAFGNVEMSAPYVKECLGEIIMSGIKTLIVQPFMVVDGVHIHEDMRGALDKQDPANRIFQHLMDAYGEPLRERLNRITVIYKPGLGAYRGVFEIFADHTLEALSGNGCLCRDGAL